MRAAPPIRSRRATVLLAVLVVIVLLTLASYKYGDLMLGEYRASSAAGRSMQSRALAESGIAYASALLATQIDQPPLAGNVWSNPDAFAGIPVGPPGTGGSGKFWVVALPTPDDKSQPHRFGVTDECGKININNLLALEKQGEDPTKSKAHAVLMAIPGMTPDVASAILDWIDPDETAREGGAENEAYSSGATPYRCKNGPLDSIEELLLVRGVTPELLFGGDRNRNGRNEGDEGGTGEIGDQGLSGYLTVYSREVNVNSLGKPRVNINGKDMEALKDALEDTSKGIAPELATFILAYRLYGGQPAPADSKSSVDSDLADVKAKIEKDLEKEGAGGNKIPSLWDLASSQVSVTIGEGRMAKRVTVPSPMLTSERQRAMLPPLLDFFTTRDKKEMSPRVNVISAPSAVIKALSFAMDGVKEEDLQPILDKRPAMADAQVTQQLYKTPAWLLTDANLKLDLVKKLDRLITSRSQVYRFQVLGLLDRPGPPSRVEAVVDINQGRPRILYWRDLSELGRGFDIRNDN